MYIVLVLLAKIIIKRCFAVRKPRELFGTQHNRPTLISLINMEVGINVEGVQKLPKSLNVEVGITMEGGIFWKKLVHKSNK